MMRDRSFTCDATMDCNLEGSSTIKKVQPGVIAISGPSGSGKTTVVKQLAELFNSPALHFDDYVDEHTYPEDMTAWLRRGADTTEIKTPRLIAELQHQIGTCQSQFIFVEEPFGRSREPVAQLIDYVVLLDIPLEICLARVIARNIDRNGQQATEFINTYLQKYESYLRNIYHKTTAQARTGAELVISEPDPILYIADIINLQSGRTK